MRGYSQGLLSAHLHREQFPRPLTITGCEDGCVYINEAIVSKEGVDESRGCVPQSQETRERLCSGTKMWELSNVVRSVCLTSFEWELLTRGIMSTLVL